MPMSVNDFVGCYALIKYIPELKNNFEKLTKVSSGWWYITENWDKLYDLYSKKDFQKLNDEFINLKKNTLI